ncbi:MAG TPA: hypothetical protein ENJ00_00980 [Phycisphaerales bacterium]|nr:hypothetical protein [Phycisphaerales bacterium]
MTGPGLQPLLDDGNEPVVPVKRRARKVKRRGPKQLWSAFVARHTDTPERARRFKIVSVSAATLLLIAGGLGAYLALRPMPRPDYEDDPLDDLFTYTLFQNEFNNLPLEERVRLVGSLTKRLESMGGGDSTLLAAFAAGISGSARDQLEENVAQLMLDFVDHFAKDYQPAADPQSKEEYLRQALVGMVRLSEELDGDPTDKSDSEILEEAFAQAERDQKAFRNPRRGPSLGGVARLANMMEHRVGSRGTPQQRARNIRLMRDLTRYLRKEDLDTGKPLGGG